MEQELKDELARVRAREQRYKSKAEAQIADLREELANMTEAKNRAEAAKNELEKRCRQLEEEIKRLTSPRTKEATSTYSDLDERPFYEILRDLFDGDK